MICLLTPWYAVACALPAGEASAAASASNNCWFSKPNSVFLRPKNVPTKLPASL